MLSSWLAPAGAIYPREVPSHGSAPPRLTDEDRPEGGREVHLTEVLLDLGDFSVFSVRGSGPWDTTISDMSRRGMLIRRPVLAGSLGLLSALPAAAQPGGDAGAEPRPSGNEQAAEPRPSGNEPAAEPRPSGSEPAAEPRPSGNEAESPLGGSDVQKAEQPSDIKATCIEDHMRGQEARLDGSLGEAQRLFERCANPACPSLVRADCQVWGVEVQDALPKVVFRLGPNVDPNDVRVSLNGAPFAVEYGVPTAFQPGSFRLEFDVDGHPPLIKQLELRAGDPRQTIAVDFPTTSPANDAMPVAPVVLTQRPPPPSAEPDLAISTASYAFGGLAVAAASVGAYFAVDAVAKHNRANETCSPLCDDDEADAVRRRLLFADIAFGVSLASAATAVIVYLTDTPAEAATHPADVWLSVASEQVGLGWGGEF